MGDRIKLLTNPDGLAMMADGKILSKRIREPIIKSGHDIIDTGYDAYATDSLARNRIAYDEWRNEVAILGTDKIYFYDGTSFVLKRTMDYESGDIGLAMFYNFPKHRIYLSVTEGGTYAKIRILDMHTYELLDTINITSVPGFSYFTKICQFDYDLDTNTIVCGAQQGVYTLDGDTYTVKKSKKFSGDNNWCGVCVLDACIYAHVSDKGNQHGIHILDMNLALIQSVKNVYFDAGSGVLGSSLTLIGDRLVISASLSIPTKQPTEDYVIEPHRDAGTNYRGMIITNDRKAVIYRGGASSKKLLYVHDLSEEYHDYEDTMVLRFDTRIPVEGLSDTQIMTPVHPSWGMSAWVYYEVIYKGKVIKRRTPGIGDDVITFDDGAGIKTIKIRVGNWSSLRFSWDTSAPYMTGGDKLINIISMGKHRIYTSTFRRCTNILDGKPMRILFKDSYSQSTSMFLGIRSYNFGKSWIWNMSSNVSQNYMLSSLDGSQGNPTKYVYPSYWDVHNITTAISFLNNCMLPENELDYIYKLWSQQDLNHDVTIHFGNSKYHSEYQQYKDILVNDFGWDITDGGTY